MSMLGFGQWRGSRGRSRPARALIAAGAAALIPAVPSAQDSQEFILPVPDAEVLLMAELVRAEVTFVSPAGIGESNDLLISATDPDSATAERVTIAPNAHEGGGKVATVLPGTKTAASLTVAAPPGVPVTILVDEVVAGDGYSLVDFRCNYAAGSETVCDGRGFSATTVERGTLLVGATLTGKENLMAGTAGGRFDVTVSYQ